MIIAIPSVTKYISDSRKNAYIQTAKEIIGGARTLVNQGKLEMYNTDVTYYIPEKCIKTENGSKTPYGEFTEAYVGVIYDGKGYSYYWISNDTARQGIKNITSYEKLDSNLIEADTTDIEIKDTIDKTGIDGRKTIKQLNDNCSNWDEDKNAKSIINENGELEEVIENPIYWALQDNDSNGTNETLVLANSKIDGNYSGVFSGNTHFSSRYDVPWTAGNYQMNDGKSLYVTNIDVTGTIYPKSTAYWFNGVGYKSNLISANLNNLKTDNVLYMEYMFNSIGYNARTLSIVGISNWNTSNVKNMEGLFWGAGYNASAFSIDVTNWNTSNVENMNYLFTQSGYNSSSWSIGNLNNWNVSKVTKMHSMFAYSGYRSTNWHVGDLSNWDTSNVNDMAALFSSTSYNATAWNVGNLGNWNTSKVTNMASMFYDTCRRCNTFYLDMSNWDTSNVTSMTNVFMRTGYSASNWTIKIPRNNGGGIINTTTTLYGKTVDINTSSSLARNSATFTLVE